MSEAEILQVLQKMKDKELADLIRSHISDPNGVKVLLIMKKLGVTISSDLNGIIASNVIWYETDDYYDDKETHLLLGGVFINGILYSLELIYNHHEKTAKIKMEKNANVLLQLFDVGE
jgi:hypothetical protein